MKIQAIFTGTNGSLGYVTGKQYELYISTGHNEIAIHRLSDGGGACVYSGILQFLKNWKEVSAI